MLPHAGTETRTWREVVELGRTLGELPDLGPTASGARIALVLDWENWWAIQNPDHPVVLDYLELVQRWHAALHRQNLAVDLVRATDDLSGYALVVLAHSYLLTDDAAATLTSFVEGGGRLLVTAFSDVVDEDDAFRDGGFQVGLREVLGVSVLEFGATAAVTADGPFGAFEGAFLAEELAETGAVTVLGRFTSGQAAGMPALTARSTGSGTAHYLATIPDDAGMTALTGWLAAEAGISPVLSAGPWVEASRRGDVVTVINHGAEPVDVAVSGTDVLTGASVESLHLEQYGWALVRESAPAE
ncbi:beta-galactosidase trimerization domain-containing protein [Rathayibacter oskolensis]|uniref:beta-galactosidase n=1 Tax=Rathayibacter oskolensis TaxID=1891671 RepID=UPI00265F4834|nr:beta-galactosidase trimerization domain-containing protein [Rathayibacter oskolensis]WKK73377.1 beta-galactosidase trimerization domain-containing protein [Rathayibacter oskolensis]